MIYGFTIDIYDIQQRVKLPTALHLFASSPSFFFAGPFPGCLAMTDNEAIQRLRACKRFPFNQSHCESKGATSHPSRLDTR